jgi:UDP-N-acetylmuramate dehydrogenase
MIRFSENISLKNFNTFGVEAKAHYFATVSSFDELKSLIRNFDPGEDKHLIIGGGSNLLFVNDFKGWLLKNEVMGIEIAKETDEEVFVTVGSGENWSDFVDFTVGKGWGGLENLSLIPGTAGAAPVQNIGAYGVEQKDAFAGIEVCNLITGKICRLNKLECDFDYRSSIFKRAEKGKWFVLNVTYRLQKTPKLHLDYAPLQKVFEKTPDKEITVKAVSDAVKRIRSSKLPEPEKLGNAGSFFKNPVVLHEKFSLLQQQFPEMPFYPLENGQVKIPAGWLIEKAGWKGKRMGNAGVHQQQALVLVNYGKATGKEILALSEAVQNDVLHKFGIALEPEVLIL